MKYYKNETYDIPVSSITYAMKGQKVLERHGITSWVGRDRSISSGCGYKLTVRGNLDQATSILSRYGIVMTGEGRAVQ